jgi:hypothetical protein
MTVVALLLAVLAAGCNALSSVLQRKANLEESPERPFGIELLVHLVLRRAWLLGGLSMIASFLLQAVALNLGTLTAVEPVLVLELPLTLMLGAVVLGRPLPARDRSSALVMAFGLALFIAVLRPSAGEEGNIGAAAAVAATVLTLAGIAVVVLVGQFGPRRGRAALFGVAAGSGFGLTASMIKVSVTRLSESGPGALFSTWETYGVAVVGVTSVVLVQAALHAGTLVAAQPGITLLDPLVSLLWGTVVLGESTRTGPVLALAGLGAGAIAVAALALARSPEID